MSILSVNNFKKILGPAIAARVIPPVTAAAAKIAATAVQETVRAGKQILGISHPPSLTGPASDVYEAAHQAAAQAIQNPDGNVGSVVLKQILKAGKSELPAKPPNMTDLDWRVLTGDALSALLTQAKSAPEALVAAAKS